MAKKSIIIEVANPKPIDGAMLDKMFSSSQAISEAASKFWKMGLAGKADLGKIKQTAIGYQVEILY